MFEADRLVSATTARACVLRAQPSPLVPPSPGLLAACLSPITPEPSRLPRLRSSYIRRYTMHGLVSTLLAALVVLATLASSNPGELPSTVSSCAVLIPKRLETTDDGPSRTFASSEDDPTSPAAPSLPRRRRFPHTRLFVTMPPTTDVRLSRTQSSAARGSTRTSTTRTSASRRSATSSCTRPRTGARSRTRRRRLSRMVRGSFPRISSPRAVWTERC